MGKRRGSGEKGVDEEGLLDLHRREERKLALCSALPGGEHRRGIDVRRPGGATGGGQAESARRMLPPLLMSSSSSPPHHTTLLNSLRKILAASTKWTRKR